MAKIRDIAKVSTIKVRNSSILSTYHSEKKIGKQTNFGEQTKSRRLFVLESDAIFLFLRD